MVDAVGPADLLRAQLRGLDAWHAARATAERARTVASASRETRMDLARRMEVLRAQHRAIVERTEVQLRDSLLVVRGRTCLRAVIAHRSSWFGDKLTAALLEHRVTVVARVDNGAEAVGCVVAEQPDLLVVEDALPMLSGIAVVREVREYAPGTLVGALGGSPSAVSDLRAAGAHAAWSRQVSPADVGQGLLALLGPALAS